MNNKARMNQIITALSEAGARELAGVLSEIIRTCPVFSEQKMNAHEFIESLTSILQGLTFKELEKYMQRDEDHMEDQRIVLTKISSQAAQTKNALCIFQDFVIFSN